MQAPRHQNFEPDKVSVIRTNDSILVMVIAGSVAGVKGPANRVSTEPLYIDIHMKASSGLRQLRPIAHTCFIYVYEGQVFIAGDIIFKDTLAVLSEGSSITIKSQISRQSWF